MKTVLLAVSVAALTFSSCTSATNTALPSGRMNEGALRTSPGDPRDAHAPANAVFNQKGIAQIHAGQTASDVRAIMQHEAERRTVDGSSESWGYVTDDNDKVMVMTWINFTGLKVSSVTRQVWVRI